MKLADVRKKKKKLGPDGMMLNRAEYKVCMKKEANQFLLILYKCEEEEKYLLFNSSSLKRPKLCICYSWAETCMTKASYCF